MGSRKINEYKILKEAIKKAGSQNKLSKIIHIRQSHISGMVNKKNP